jgi:hypothetical protein
MVWVPTGEPKKSATDLEDTKSVHGVWIAEGPWLGTCDVINAWRQRYVPAIGGRAA